MKRTQAMIVVIGAITTMTALPAFGQNRYGSWNRSSYDYRQPSTSTQIDWGRPSSSNWQPVGSRDNYRQPLPNSYGPATNQTGSGYRNSYYPTYSQDRYGPAGGDSFASGLEYYARENVREKPIRSFIAAFFSGLGRMLSAFGGF